MGEHSIRVLLIDDDAVDAELTGRTLRSVGFPRFVIERVASLAEAAERIESGAYDVALLDLGLPDSPRAVTFERFRRTCSPDLPVIVLSGPDDEESALQSLDLGVPDFLRKGDVTPELLSRSIRHALQRRRLLDQLKEANVLLEQKNDRLAQLYNLAQQFVENVSHEFRTPLTVIREFTSIVHDGLDGPVTPKQAEHLQKVLHRTDDLALMVDDMLDISKLEAGLLGVWRRPCHVEEMIQVVRGQIKGRAESKRITLAISVDVNLPCVFCDEEKARRVMVNLAVNAIKFTPEGGAVEIWSRRDPEGGDVVIGVTDTGSGLSEENLSVIFQRFRQVDQGLHSSTKGFGLGLNIANALVALNLGKISVKSSVGAGSTFSFTLPIYDSKILLQRYLDRTKALIGEDATVSLFSATIDLSSCPSAATVVDEFLQRSVRANDLVVTYDNASWIIAAVCASANCQRLMGRLVKEWDNFLRSCPNLKLPRLEMKLVQTRAVKREYEQFCAAYMALANRKIDGKAAPTGQTVLVVDDDREVSQRLGDHLQAAGFTVVTAGDGEAGLLAALAHRPDAVVLDLKIPKKDGMAVLRELRNHRSTKRTPIVILSASIRDQHTAIEAGANFFVLKPFQASQVLSALESSLHRETPI